MRLFGTVFTQDITVEPLVPTDFPVTWPDATLAQIGIVGTHFYLLVSNNQDPNVTSIRLDLVRNLDSQVIHSLVLTKGIPGWETQGTGNTAIAGLATQLETVLPVSPADTPSHWFVTQAGGLTVRVTPLTPPGPAQPFSALIVMHLQYVQMTSIGTLIVPAGTAKGIEFVVAGKVGNWLMKSDGTLWFTNDATVASPTWTQIATP